MNEFKNWNQMEKCLKRKCKKTNPKTFQGWVTTNYFEASTSWQDANAGSIFTLRQIRWFCPATLKVDTKPSFSVTHRLPSCRTPWARADIDSTKKTGCQHVTADATVRHTACTRNKTCLRTNDRGNIKGIPAVNRQYEKKRLMVVCLAGVTEKPEVNSSASSPPRLPCFSVVVDRNNTIRK